ncbi:MAG: glycosyltransferase family 39 protein [Fuerstiella sp.]
MVRDVPAAVCLLAVHATMLAWSGYRHSPTIDEPAHLAAGISHWQFGHMDLYSVNPPLVRMIAALPVLAAKPETAWGQFRRASQSRAEFQVGEAFADANGPRIFWLITLARWSCIPFSLLGGWVCFQWARELFGAASGLLSLTLWCFSPTILGNAALITADVPAASLCVTTLYLFFHWLRRPSWATCYLTAVGLGIALLTKSSLILLCGLLPVLWATVRLLGRNPEVGPNGLRADVSKRRQTLQLTTMVVIAMLVLNLGYGFEGSFTQLKEFSFRSQALGGDHDGRRSSVRGNRFSESWTGSVPIPLPANYVIGIDAQKYDFETGLRSYLLGEIKTAGEGWWWFYLYAAAVKVPLGTWVLAFLTVPVAGRWGRADQQLLLIGPALCFASVVSSQVGLNFFRYLLPAFPFAFIWISQLLSDRIGNRSRISLTLTALGLLWSIASSLWYFPHSLAYFNELVGGPKSGYRIMVDANLDWGQDLLYLKEWLEDHPEAAGMELHYYGPVAPVLAGLPVTDVTSRKDRLSLPDGSPEPSSGPSKWVAVSVTRIAHQTAFHRRHGGQGENWFADLFEREPDDRIGYSIHLYRNGEDAAK